MILDVEFQMFDLFFILTESLYFYTYKKIMYKNTYMTVSKKYFHLTKSRYLQFLGMNKTLQV